MTTTNDDWRNPSASPRGPGRWRRPSWLAMGAIWTLVFLVAWSIHRPAEPSPLHQPNFEPRTVAPRNDLASGEQATIDVFRNASPSVVYITSAEYGHDLFGLNVFEIPRGTGSGFIYDKGGHVVTNYHVIQPGTHWRVRLGDGSEWKARAVGVEPDRDLAVLKIDAPQELLKPISVGTSKDLLVGQKVLAIGNPFGLDHTLTVGVVSALGREIESVTGRKIRDVVQTDAAINPGNSGGPLLDSAGRLIGVNTQIASPSGASAGIGFAVPVDIVNEVVPDLIRYGRVRRPTLGVLLVSDGIARRLSLPGVLIESVFEDTGAAKAGLRGTLVDRRGYVRQMGDIIVKVDDKGVRTGNELKDVLELHEVGDQIHVTVLRDDHMQTVEVKLQYND